MNPNDKETNDPSLGAQPVVPEPQSETVSSPSPAVAEPGADSTQAPLTDSSITTDTGNETIVASADSSSSPTVEGPVASPSPFVPENPAASNPTETNVADAPAPVQGPVADSSAPVSPVGVPTVTPVSNNNTPADATGGKSKNILIIAMIVLGLLVLLAALGLILA